MEITTAMEKDTTVLIPNRGFSAYVVVKFMYSSCANNNEIY